MEKSFSIIFGGIVAYILLLLYSCSVVYMTKSVIQHGLAEAPKGADGKVLSKEPLKFRPGIIYVVTTIGGLVSALVVSKLTITKPGEEPALVRAIEGATPAANRLSSFLHIAYLVVWLLIGLNALIVGVMVFPDSNSTLGEIGTTWLGLAVASGYAYFGLDPQKK